MLTGKYRPALDIEVQTSIIGMQGTRLRFKENIYENITVRVGIKNIIKDKFLIFILS